MIFKYLGSSALFFPSDLMNALKLQENVVTRGCKKLEDKTPLLRLKNYLFCNYDSTVRPNNPKTVINVTLRLIPKMMEFVSVKEIIIKILRTINRIRDIQRFEIILKKCFMCMCVYVYVLNIILCI